MVLALLLMFRAADSALLYGLAASLFGIGYGLAYSVLNGILANAVDTEVQSQALQIFTCSYFLGIFGFPALAGILLTRFGINGLLAGLVAIGGLELGGAVLMATRSGTFRKRASPGIKRPISERDARPHP